MLGPFLRSVLPALLVLAVSPACSSSDAASSSTTCSTGTPYTDDTVFPEDTQPPPDAKECIARCGDTSTGSFGVGGVPVPLVSALPTGSCEIAGETCHLSAVRRFCPLTSNDGSLISFTCRCTNGQWSCAGIAVSGGVHEGPCPDAGAL